MVFTIDKLRILTYGGGAFFMIVSMLVSAIYMGNVYTESLNWGLKTEYGRDGEIFKAVLAACILSVFCCLLFIVSVVFALRGFKTWIKVVVDITGMAICLGVAIAEGIILNYTDYGFKPYPKPYDYCTKSDFTKHTAALASIYPQSVLFGKDTDYCAKDDSAKSLSSLKPASLNASIRADFPAPLVFASYLVAALNYYPINFVYLGKEGYSEGSVYGCAAKKEKLVDIGKAGYNLPQSVIKTAEEFLGDCKECQYLDLTQLADADESEMIGILFESLPAAGNINPTEYDSLDDDFDCLGSIKPSTAIKMFMKFLKMIAENRDEYDEETKKGNYVEAAQIIQGISHASKHSFHSKMMYCASFFLIIFQVISLVLVIVSMVLAFLTHSHHYTEGEGEADTL